MTFAAPWPITLGDEPSDLSCPRGTGRTKRWLLLAALNFGFALSTKHLALSTLALTCPGLLPALRSRGVSSWRQAFLAALRSLSLEIALPWYLRSYVATGNPVFGTMYTLFGAPPERWNALAQARQQAFLPCLAVRR